MQLRRDGGFTLIEIAIVTAILGLIMAMGIKFTSGYLDQRHTQQARQQLDRIEQAIVSFVSVERRLPCPAAGPGGSGLENPVGGGDCANQVGGVLPWRTLGLSEADAVDPWGQHFTYRVDDDAVVGAVAYTRVTATGGMNFSACDPAGDVTTALGRDCDSAATTRQTAVRTATALSGKGLYVCQDDSCNTVTGSGVLNDPTKGTGAAYVLVSHGPNGVGGYTRANTMRGGTGSAIEQINAADRDPVPAYWVDSANRAVAGDDLVRHPTILAVAGKAGLGPNAFDQSLGSGGGGTFSLDASPTKIVVSDPTKVAVRSSTGGAAQEDGTNLINFSGNAQGDTATGGLTTLPGINWLCAWVDWPFNVKSQVFRAYFKFRLSPVEQVGQQNGTADGFTFAVVPTFTQAPAKKSCGGPGETLGFATRDWEVAYSGYTIPTPKMAVEFDIYQNEAAQQDPDVNHVALLYNDTVHHDTNTNRTNPSCWSNIDPISKNGSTGGCTYYTDWADRNWLENRSNDPYPVRIEIERQCDSDCSNCGDGSGTYIHTRAWIDCKTSGCGDIGQNSNAVPSNATLDSATVRTLNWCTRDPGGSSGFDQINIGFTMSTYGGQTALQITDFVAGTFSQ